MADDKKSWEHRLKGGPADVTVDFVESLSVDKRLYKYDIAGSIAHARMLSEVGLIKEQEFTQIKEGLLAIGDKMEQGQFVFDKRTEDIHMAIEAALVEQIGEAGKKLHTGRSRNDQIATDIRLWIRDQIELLQRLLRQLQQAFVELADKSSQIVMPAYTHLQRAQPISAGAYLLSFVEQFERDYKRLGNCADLMNVSPLGSGALAGSTLKLERKSTAEQLGFADITANSIDAVSDRDFAAEFIFDCSLIAAHLSRLAEDWIIYSTNEFAFVKIADQYCTSSSMMPQKRNPDLLELIRGKTGSVYGALVGMLTILKAQPSGYNRDLQEDKFHIFTASDTVEKSLVVAREIIKHTEFDADRISSGLDAGFLDATALAEYLVGRGVAFRQAHGIVGQLVDYCEQQSKRLAELDVGDFHKFSPDIGSDVYEWLGAKAVVNRYTTEGSAGIEQTAIQIEKWKKRLADKT